MQNRPVPVIVVSSRSDDENVFRAMEFGAVTFIPKPSARISPELFDIRDDLHEKVKAIVKTDMNKVLRRSSQEDAETTRKRIRAGIRKGRKGSDVELVAIGASTGGPPALQKIISAIQDEIPVGFAISQHMPPGFTRAFADRLNKFSALEVKEAEDGDEVRPGRVLVAPGGKNLTFRQHGGNVVVKVAEPETGQRYVPSVDHMFKSAAEVYGSSVLGVVLTGMGNDGAEGTRRVKLHGGKVLAESEESSVVFGMPKEAIATGDVSRIVGLEKMCDAILRECGF
jgi:two-component system chemotaxis response regulator CheB